MFSLINLAALSNSFGVWGRRVVIFIHSNSGVSSRAVVATMKIGPHSTDPHLQMPLWTGTNGLVNQNDGVQNLGPYSYFRTKFESVAKKFELFASTTPDLLCEGCLKPIHEESSTRLDSYEPPRLFGAIHHEMRSQLTVMAKHREEPVRLGGRERHL